jgi:hypothetical protein
MLYANTCKQRRGEYSFIPTVPDGAIHILSRVQMVRRGLMGENSGKCRWVRQGRAL